MFLGPRDELGRDEIGTVPFVSLNPVTEDVVMRILFAVVVVLSVCLVGSEALAAAPDQAKPDQVAPDQAKPDQANPDQAKPDQAKPDQAKPDQVKSDKSKGRRRSRG